MSNGVNFDIQEPAKTSFNNMEQPLNSEYFGRDELLKNLKIWANGPQSIVCLHGFLGSGKSSLIFTFLKSIAPHYCGIEKIFYWRFDDAEYTISAFFEAAIQFFSPADQLPTEYNRYRILLDYINKSSSMLILDDVEACLNDAQFNCFFQEIAINGLHHGGLIILISQLPIALLDNCHPKALNALISPIAESDCLNIFKLYNVKGTDPQLCDAAKDLNYFPLSVTLMSRILNHFYDGDITKRNEVRLYDAADLDDESEKNLQIKILSAYKSILSKLKSDERDFFNILCFFRNSFDKEDVINIFHDLSYNYTDKQVAHFLEVLRYCAVINNNSPNGYYVNSLIRDDVYDQTEHNDEFISRNKVFAEYYKAKFLRTYPTEESEAGINSIRAIEPLYHAIFYYTHANMYREAYQILWEKVYRKRKFFSQRVLGAFTNDIFSITQFFDSSNNWEPKCKSVICDEDIAWLYAALSYLKRNIGAIEESIKLRRLELKLQQSLKNYSYLAADSTHLARLYALKCRNSDAIETFEKANEYLNDAAKTPHNISNEHYSAALDLNEVKTYLYVRWAHFYFSRGSSPEAIACLKQVDINCLKDKTDIFYYILMEISYCTNRKKLKEIKKQFANYKNQDEIPYYVVSYIKFLDGLLPLKTSQLGKQKIKPATYSQIISLFDNAIEISKKFQRMEQYPYMLLLYMSTIIDYIPLDTVISVSNKAIPVSVKFDELAKQSKEILNFFHIPFYHGEYLYLCMKKARSCKDTNYEQLYAEWTEHSEYETYFSAKIKGLGER